MHSRDELQQLAETYLAELALTPELGGLEEAVRYALAGGGKRIRPVICLATGEAAGGDPGLDLPAAAAPELVHNLSRARDDLRAPEADAARRSKPSTRPQYRAG